MRSVLGNELKKIFCRRELWLLLVAFGISSGFLVYFFQHREKPYIIPEQYKEVYRSIEGLSLEAALDYLSEKQQSSDLREKFLVQEVLNEVQETTGYEAYRRNVIESAARMNQVSIFQKKESYAQRNVQKTAKRYETLPPFEASIGPVLGVTMISGITATDLLAVLFAVGMTILVVIREKELGQLLLTKTTYYGKKSHAVSKLLVCGAACALFVFLTQTTNIIVAACTYGLGDLNRSIQSIPQYQASVFSLSVGQFLLLSAVIKLITMMLLTLVSFLIASASKSYMGLICSFLCVLGLEGLAFFFIPSTSLFSLFKCLNLFAGFDTGALLGGYQHLNLFGFPFWYLWILIVFLVVAMAVLPWLGMEAYAKTSAFLQESKRKEKRFILFPERTEKVFMHECYRLFYGEKVLWILLLAVTLNILTFSPAKEFFATEEDMFYKQYMLLLEGKYSDEVQRKIEKEEQDFSLYTEQMMQALAKNPDAATPIMTKYQTETKKYSVLDRVKSHAEYLRKMQGAFVYDTGYRILVNDEIGKSDNFRLNIWVNLLLVLCTGFLFSGDYQTGMHIILRTTPKGRWALFLRREILGILVLIILFAIVYVPFVYDILTLYGTQGLTFPACSLEILHWCPPEISIKEYLLLFFALRFLILWIKMNVLFYISTKLKSKSFTVLVGVGLFVGSLVVMY